MKITKSVLRKIILEEFAKVQEVDGVAGTTYTPGTPGEEPEAEAEPEEKAAEYLARHQPNMAGRKARLFCCNQSHTPKITR